MSLTEERLAHLKERIAIIDRKYAPHPRPPASNPAAVPERDARWFIEEWSEGQVVENAFGAHFQTERLFASHRSHGIADIGALADLPANLFDASSVPPQRWAFLDTETTGLAGGPSSYAFLIGVGRITGEGFRVRQFFLREYAEEPSVLAALTAHLNEFDSIVTYNGKSYDQPLLEARYHLLRQKSPFSRLLHFDLLHSARRLWKLRLKDCRLMQLEQRILGVCREGDLPGELIPYVYFEYLRSREALRLVPIFHHNAMDILTLACLTAIVPAAFQNTDSESLVRVGVRSGEDLASIALWFAVAKKHAQALDLFKRAVDAGLPDPLLFRALWKIAHLERKLQHPHAALTAFTELAGCRNEYRASALEELAKYYEHEENNLALALEFTKQALNHVPNCAVSAPLLRRKTRLERRLAKPHARRTLRPI